MKELLPSVPSVAEWLFTDSAHLMGASTMCRCFVVFLVIAAVLVAGCASVPPESYVFDPQIIIHADSEAVWHAVTDFLEVSKLPIDTIAKDSGLIVTGGMRCPVSSDDSQQGASCFCEAGAPGYEETGRCAVLVKPVAGGTELRAIYACDVARVSSFVGLDRFRARGRSTGYFEQLLFAYVLAEIEGTALPDVPTLGVAGGTSVPAAGRPSEGATAVVDAGYDVVWHAVVEFFVVSGLPMDVSDRESGLLVTSWMDVSDPFLDPETELYCVCGTGGSLDIDSWTRGKFTVSVKRVSEGRSEVKVSSLYQQQIQGEAGPMVCTSTGNLEVLFLAYVQARVGGEQLPRVPRLLAGVGS